ncbi:MAG: hypothetical protein ABSG63_10085 [Spirochaetia bacterium]|jgi:hypothetical protein
MPDVGWKLPVHILNKTPFSEAGHRFQTLTPSDVQPIDYQAERDRFIDRVNMIGSKRTKKLYAAVRNWSASSKS